MNNNSTHHSSASPLILVIITTASATILCFFAAHFPQGTHACGPLVHETVAERARVWFHSDKYPQYKDLASKHKDAFQAGAPFPDWGYIPLKPCSAHHEAGEATHWEPFIDHAARYIHRKPKPWDEDTQKLVAFLMGVESHSIADILWHSLERYTEGFIVASSHINFNGSYSEAHSNADNGGDVLVDFAFDTSFFRAGSAWYVPIDDLLEIYHEMKYTTVTWRSLLECSSILWTATFADKIDSKILRNKYGSQSTFLFEQFQEYFQGGLDDMAIATVKKWHLLIEEIETGNGTVADYPPHLASSELGRSRSLPDNHWANRPVPQLQPEDYTVERTKRGIIIKDNRKREVEDKPYNGNGIDGSSATKEEEASSSSSSSASGFAFTEYILESKAQYSYAGRSLAKGDFNSDGIDDLVVGLPGYFVPGETAPQIGAVYIIFGGRKMPPPITSIDLASLANVVILGSDVVGNEPARFGYAVATVDLNADGVDDLAVSAPYHNDTRGSIFVFFGSTDASRSLSNTPNMVIHGHLPLENVGTVLKAAHLDDDGHADLLIGSPYADFSLVRRRPQSGAVTAFLSSYAGHNPILHLDNRNDAAWFVKGTDLGAYAWCGAELEVVTTQTQTQQKKFLVVGCPTSDNSRGRIVGYEITNVVGKNISAKPVVNIEGQSEFDKLGTAFSVGYLMLPDTTTTTITDEDAAYAQKNGDPTSNTAVIALAVPSRPHSTKNFFRREVQHWQAGSVIVVPFDSLLLLLKQQKQQHSTPPLATNPTTLDALLPHAIAIFDSSTDFAHLGWQVGFADLDGDRQEDDLYISEPWRQGTRTGMASAAAPQSGAVHLWHGRNIYDDINDDNNNNEKILPWWLRGEVVTDCCDKSATTTLSLQQQKSGGGNGDDDDATRAFFGTTVLVLDFNADGVCDIAVAAPYASPSSSSSQQHDDHHIPQGGLVALYLSPDNEH